MTNVIWRRWPGCCSWAHASLVGLGLSVLGCAGEDVAVVEPTQTLRLERPAVPELVAPVSSDPVDGPATMDEEEALGLLEEAHRSWEVGRLDHVIELLEPASVRVAGQAGARLQALLQKARNAGMAKLRKEAAEAYQTALPLLDPRARRYYVEQAQALLAKGLAKYPQADAAPAVREHMASLQGQIESLLPRLTPEPH